MYQPGFAVYITLGRTIYINGMPQNRNSASRLYAFLIALPGHQGNTQNLSAWADALSITESDTSRQARLVSERLAALSQELDHIRDGMKIANFSVHLYTNALAAFDAAFSPLYLSNTWSHIRQQLTPEHMLALQFCGEILPDEEDEILQADLDEISSLLTELEALAVGSDQIPERLRRLIENQVADIRLALASYKISGARVLREAFRSSYGELVEAKDIITDHRSSPEVSKLAEVWRKVNTVADTALKVDGILQLGQEAWLFIESVIEGAD
jgi:hypothetical protein